MLLFSMLLSGRKIEISRYNKVMVNTDFKNLMRNFALHSGINTFDDILMRSQQEDYLYTEVSLKETRDLKNFKLWISPIKAAFYINSDFGLSETDKYNAIKPLVNKCGYYIGYQKYSECVDCLLGGEHDHNESMILRTEFTLGKS